MKNYKYILFDLDGTLIEPKVGITKSVAYALNYFGIQVDDLDSLCKFIGPPLRDSFVKYYGFSKEKAEEAVAKFREYFRPHGVFENDLYDGVPELLIALKEADKKVILATSKPQVFADMILKHYDIYKYFDVVVGSELDGSREKKGDVIAFALEQAGVTDKTMAIMVGDREHDVIGAKENGLDSIGVLYGHGTLNELQEHGANGIAETVKELQELLLK